MFDGVTMLFHRLTIEILTSRKSYDNRKHRNANLVGRISRREFRLSSFVLAASGIPGSAIECSVALHSSIVPYYNASQRNSNQSDNMTTRLQIRPED